MIARNNTLVPGMIDYERLTAEIDALSGQVYHAMRAAEENGSYIPHLDLANPLQPGEVAFRPGASSVLTDIVNGQSRRMRPEGIDPDDIVRLRKSSVGCQVLIFCSTDETPQPRYFDMHEDPAYTRGLHAALSGIIRSVRNTRSADRADRALSTPGATAYSLDVPAQPRTWRSHIPSRSALAQQ